MDAVHVDRDQHRLQPALQPVGKADIPMLASWLVFLLLDVMRYLVHRCEHAVPFLWRFHALHHSDPDVDVTTSVRHHPVEYVLATGFYWLAALALGIPAIVILSHAL